MESYEIKIILFVLAPLVIFVYGLFVVPLQIFPYSFVKSYVDVAGSVKDALNIDNYNHEIRWVDEVPPETGVVLSKEGAFPDGYIVMTTTHDSNIRMIDMAGEVVHEWSLPYDAVWDNQDHIIALKKLDNKYFYARDFHLYENGDLLMMMSAGGVTPWGMGLVKVDKDSKVLWKYTGYTNNDFEVAPDGTIYVIEHEIREDDLQSVHMETLPFLEDNIVVLNPEGEEIKRISLIDALDHSEYSDFIKQFKDDTSGDPTHSNSIAYIPVDNPRIPWLKRGYLMISVRNINAMVVLDPQSGEVVHAQGMISRMQHDFDYLDNGNMLIFDNRGSFTKGGYSRVIEIDPATQNVIWAYDPPAQNGHEFESGFFGAQQRLDNGVTFITQAEAGRIFAVTKGQEVVWDYYLPLALAHDGADYIATVTSFEHFDKDAITFLQ